MKKLCNATAKMEGKKSQAKVGDVREILNCATTLIAQDIIENSTGHWSEMKKDLESKVFKFSGRTIGIDIQLVLK